MAAVQMQMTKGISVRKHASHPIFKPLNSKWVGEGIISMSCVVRKSSQERCFACIFIVANCEEWESLTTHSKSLSNAKERDYLTVNTHSTMHNHKNNTFNASLLCITQHDMQYEVNLTEDL